VLKKEKIMSGAFYLDQSVFDIVMEVEQEPAIQQIIQAHNNTPVMNPILQLHIVTPDSQLNTATPHSPTPNINQEISEEDPSSQRNLSGDFLAE
jgi:hypothetical protein